MAGETWRVEGEEIDHRRLLSVRLGRSLDVREFRD